MKTRLITFYTFAAGSISTVAPDGTTSHKADASLQTRRSMVLMDASGAVPVQDSTILLKKAEASAATLA